MFVSFISNQTLCVWTVEPNFIMCVCQIAQASLSYEYTGWSYQVLLLHHGVTESSPSGRCQQYFSSGRHLAAAARVTLSTILAGMGQFT